MEEAIFTAQVVQSGGGCIGVNIKKEIRAQLNLKLGDILQLRVLKTGKTLAKSKKEPVIEVSQEPTNSKP